MKDENMRKSTLKNLKKYAALAIRTTAVATTSKASIIYTDINPEINSL